MCVLVSLLIIHILYFLYIIFRLFQIQKPNTMFTTASVDLVSISIRQTCSVLTGKLPC